MSAGLASAWYYVTVKYCVSTFVFFSACFVQLADWPWSFSFVQRRLSSGASALCRLKTKKFGRLCLSTGPVRGKFRLVAYRDACACVHFTIVHFVRA